MKTRSHLPELSGNLKERIDTPKMSQKGPQKAPKMEPKSVQKRLKTITEGAETIIQLSLPTMWEDGLPQGPPKSLKKAKIGQERVPKHSLVSRRVPKRPPRGPRGAPGTILGSFFMFFGCVFVVFPCVYCNLMLHFSVALEGCLFRTFPAKRPE